MVRYGDDGFEKKGFCRRCRQNVFYTNGTERIMEASPTMVAPMTPSVEYIVPFCRTKWINTLYLRLNRIRKSSDVDDILYGANEQANEPKTEQTN